MKLTQHDFIDPAPFKALASSARQAHTQRNEPKDSPSTPTSVQQYIRDQKRLIIDPVIASLPVLSSDSEEEPPDPEELRRIQEREKIRDLKKRRINGGGSVFGGLGLRKPADAVYVRMDQADESAEVDIWGGGGSSVVAGKGTPQSSIADTHDDNLDMDPGNADGPSYGGKHFGGKSWPIPERSPKITRQRVPTRKASATVSSSSRSSRAKSKQAEVPALDDEVEDEGDDDRDTRATKEVVLDKKGKPRPETYKQAWSVSEQHLLEQLLEQIPDGEKNRLGLAIDIRFTRSDFSCAHRWAKISKAMNGRRTARQVASRVQKYYEKLKRFGVEVGQS